jgi:hypothetical protein
MTKPRSRTAGLIVEELDGEVLVYDTATDRAHCLNRTAALVWRWSDGATSVRDLSRRLQRELPIEAGAAGVVEEALRVLEKAHLLERPLDAPAHSARSRRQALRTLARGAALLPVVSSIVAPRAAEAATCVPIDGPCTAPGQCCPNNQNQRCCRNGRCANGSGNCI